MGSFSGIAKESNTTMRKEEPTLYLRPGKVMDFIYIVNPVLEALPRMLVPQQLDLLKAELGRFSEPVLSPGSRIYDAQPLEGLLPYLLRSACNEVTGIQIQKPQPTKGILGWLLGDEVDKRLVTFRNAPDLEVFCMVDENPIGAVSIEFFHRGSSVEIHRRIAVDVHDWIARHRYGKAV